MYLQLKGGWEVNRFSACTKNCTNNKPPEYPPPSQKKLSIISSYTQATRTHKSLGSFFANTPFKVYGGSC